MDLDRTQALYQSKLFSFFFFLFLFFFFFYCHVYFQRREPGVFFDFPTNNKLKKNSRHRFFLFSRMWYCRRFPDHHSRPPPLLVQLRTLGARLPEAGERAALDAL